ncbi:FAD-binding protein [Isoptericola sp. NPDC019482]|uniref:FAD-binding protein n=1 Tax=Isoptericola sp. NPDC019482 TaxID=3154688 RepID=UPI003481A400
MRKDQRPLPAKTDDVWLLGRAWSTPSGFVRGARFVLRALRGVVTGKRLVVIGNALMTSFGRTLLVERELPLWLSSPLEDLVVDDGRVVIEIARDAGAALELMDDAWWGASIEAPPGGTPAFIVGERSMPFSIMVDARGERFANESEGVVTDADGRTLREDGSVIEGLYAAGNTSASVMGRTYPGPGSTIGPACVFGLRAARQMAGDGD